MFCFGSKIRRNVQESLFWKSLYLARKRHLYEIPQGWIQKIQIEVAGKLASYMDSFYFAVVIVKIIQKSTEKKGGWRRPLGHPLNPRMVPMGFYNPVSTQFFFRSLLPSVPRFNPQSLPSNEASPGSQKTYWTLLKTLLHQSCHTELFLTQLKTALDHKTEKVKF